VDFSDFSAPCSDGPRTLAAAGGRAGVLLAGVVVQRAPTPERSMSQHIDEQEQQRAKWDLLLADIELCQEQLRRARPFNPWPVMIAGLATGAGLFAAGAAFFWWLRHL
jgi:hypothetical protein